MEELTLQNLIMLRLQEWALAGLLQDSIRGKLCFIHCDKTQAASSIALAQLQECCSPISMHST